jgi:DNA primase
MANDLEEIKNRLNIVDVLGEYIRLEKAGANWKATCPFHNEKTPSFSVSEEKQIWHCFGCQKGGDIFGFVMEMEGLEFRDALKLLAEKAGVELQGYSPKKAEEKNKTLEILELATKFYETQLWKGNGKVKIIKYLRDRGLKDETIKEFRLGYAPPGWRNLLSFLLGRGYKTEEIKKTGLLVQKSENREQKTGNKKQEKNTAQWSLSPDHCYDRFRDRIIFPIADYSGRVVGYSARVAPGGDESQAKYVNTPETEVYHKSKILYGLDKAKNEARQKDSILLVEGNMDVIASSQAGIKNVMAVSGTALTSEQIKIIKRYTSNIKMFFDMDIAGETATKKSIKMGLANEMNISVVTLPKGKDAADLAREKPEELVKAVGESLPAMEYFYQNTFSKFDKEKAEDKKKMAEIILDMLTNLGNAIEKNHWIKKLSEDLNITESILTGLIKKATLKGRTTNSDAPKSKIDSEIHLGKKIDTLIDEILGLMLVSTAIWKKVAETKSAELTSLKDSLLISMLGKGQGVAFDFERFLNILEKEEEKNRAENLFFTKKYRLDINNNLEEVIITDPERELGRVLNEIKKELMKEELQKITADLRVAEGKKDADAVKFLRSEFNKITKEM